MRLVLRFPNLNQRFLILLATFLTFLKNTKINYFITYPQPLPHTPTKITSFENKTKKKKTVVFAIVAMYQISHTCSRQQIDVQESQ
jgi:hypothetical protein